MTSPYGTWVTDSLIYNSLYCLVLYSSCIFLCYSTSLTLFTVLRKATGSFPYQSALNNHKCERLNLTIYSKSHIFIHRVKQTHINGSQ